MTAGTTKSHSAMSLKDKNKFIIAGFADDCLKILALAKRRHSADIIDAVSFNLERGHTPEYLRGLIGEYLKKEGCRHCPVIISLPRSEASLKLVRIPSENREEIGKIISLHASTYLPCPPDKVCVSYEVVSSDPAGYSQVNLAIVNKDIIERYRGLIDKTYADNPKIVLSSFGLNWLYGYFCIRNTEDLVFVDIDRASIEICILSKGKLTTSRYFKQDCLRPEWKELFLKEVKITCDSLKKELPSVSPGKIVITGGAYIDGLLEAVKDKAGLPVEALSYMDRFRVFKEYGAQGCSFASLLGVALNKKTEAPFIFISGEEREEKERRSGLINSLKVLILLLVFIFVLSAAVKFDIRNKELYIKKIDRELGSIKSEARKLEQMKGRFDLISARSSAKSLVLAMLGGIYEAIPFDVSLADFYYYALEGKVIIKGEARGMDNVFLFVSKLEGLSVFKGYKVKLNYITNKKTAQGEAAYFEIICLK